MLPRKWIDLIQGGSKGRTAWRVCSSINLKSFLKHSAYLFSALKDYMWTRNVWWDSSPSSGRIGRRVGLWFSIPVGYIVSGKSKFSSSILSLVPIFADHTSFQKTDFSVVARSTWVVLKPLAKQTHGAWYSTKLLVGTTQVEVAGWACSF